MKSIYISFPIKWHEDTYEQRLNAAVAYVKAKYPEYDRIVTPKDVASMLDAGWLRDEKPEYRDYLTADIMAINGCDAIFMCNGWSHSKGCRAEHRFAKAIGIDIYYQI